MHTSLVTDTQTPSNAARAAKPAIPSEDVTASFCGPPHSFLDVGHSRLAYRRFGQGPDVVFVHGWPLPSGTFRKLVPLLADAFTCHLIDLPGAGQTESGEGVPIELVAHATTLRRTIDLLGLERYALLAHDSGGFIGFELGADGGGVSTCGIRAPARGTSRTRTRS